MKNVCGRLAVMAALILAPASMAFGGSPDLEIRAGSTVSILSLGGEVDIAPQFLSMAPAEDPLFDMRGLESLIIPRYETAFEEFVDLGQNQELQVSVNSATGAVSVETPLWIVDSDGNAIEVPLTLSTAVPVGFTCTNFPFCIGNPSDPDYCKSEPWDTQTGEVRLVGVVLVPDDSDLTIECSGIAFEIEATIAAVDTDGDGHIDAVDNCPDHYNSNQADDDGAQDDGIGDVCDNCPSTYNPTQRDNDADGTGNSCEPLQVNFQPDASAVPAGYVKDTGAQYSQVTDRGWLGVSLPNRDRGMGGDQRLETFVFASVARAWEVTLHPALYDVSLAIGDRSFPQGPHRVIVEQATVFEDVMTAAGENLLGDVDGSYVSDGRMTVEIGGAGANTMLNFVDVTESGNQPFLGRFVNFQPAASLVPLGFEADTGLAYDLVRGYGWEADREYETRDRGVLGDRVLDTLYHATGAPRTWELDLPADFYDVTISIGDPQYAQGPQSVMVEGETWLDAGMSAAGEFLSLTGRVLVVDGALTVTTGQPGGNTVMNYIAVTSTPRDLDEDGVANLNDNCIDLYNPLQEDSNGNGVGDLCSADTDGDGHTDPMDNCPAIPNVDQLDTDGDQYGDACDCAPTNGNVFAPAVEVAALNVFGGQDGSSTLFWDTQDEESGPGTGYDLVSGTLSTLHVDTGYASATCLQPDTATNLYLDGRAAPTADGFYYLVRGDNECSPAGTYGLDDVGVRATLDASGPCP